MMSTCCGTCQKQVGCGIIGSLTVASCGGLIVQSSINLAAFANNRGMFLADDDDTSPRLYLRLEITCLVLSIIGVIVGFIFIYAVWKDRPNFMLPFIAWYVIAMIFAILDAVHIFHHISKSYAVLVVIAIPIGCYFIWVALSHMLERRTGRKEEAVMQLPPPTRGGDKERRASWVQ